VEKKIQSQLFSILMFHKVRERRESGREEERERERERSEMHDQSTLNPIIF